ncbi:MAG: DUF2959 domain-containing protein [Planctomycetota bacterium JB042]
MSPFPGRRAAALAVLLATASCSSMYYGMMESFGVEKRHIMVDRVEEARDDQEDAKEQFKTTLERFKELTGADGGDLESTYNALAKDYERCVDDADAVRDRIESIEDVAEDMFDEWRTEIDEISNVDYRRTSEDLLDDTRQRYAKMIAAMKDAEAKMAPVLQAFKDQVLFLKHNLNAQFIAQLQNTVLQIEGDVDVLIADMERSIQEADEFIEGMNAST